MRPLAGIATSVFVCAAMGAGPSEAVREKTLANHTPEHVAAVCRTFERQRFDLVSLEHPGAEVSALLAAWDERFSPALQAMDQYLTGALEGWASRSPLNQSLREGDAESAIERAQRAVDGLGPSPAIHYAAAFDPRYDDALAAMRSGVTRDHTTDGSGASDGLRLGVTAPLSWIPGHARGDGTVMRLVSEAGAGLASLTIKVVPLAQDEREPTPEQLSANVVENAAHPDRTGLGNEEFAFLGVRGSAVVFRDAGGGRYGATRSHEKHYQCVHEGRVIKFEFAVLDRARSADALLAADVIGTEFDRLEPLFDEMVSRASVAPER